MKSKKDIETYISSGPGKDCKCQVCVFNKSQAPGQPYDITECPLWNKRKTGKLKKAQ